MSQPAGLKVRMEEAPALGAGERGLTTSLLLPLPPVPWQNSSIGMGGSSSGHCPACSEERVKSHNHCMVGVGRVPWRSLSPIFAGSLKGGHTETCPGELWMSAELETPSPELAQSTWKDKSCLSAPCTGTECQEAVVLGWKAPAFSWNQEQSPHFSPAGRGRRAGAERPGEGTDGIAEVYLCSCSCRLSMDHLSWVVGW